MQGLPLTETTSTLVFFKSPPRPPSRAPLPGGDWGVASVTRYWPIFATFAIWRSFLETFAIWNSF